jgi:hypothetical protein
MSCDFILGSINHLSLILYASGAVAGYFFLALYVFAPWKVRNRQSKSVTVNYTSIEPAEFPPEILSVFSIGATVLEQAGFECLGSVTQARNKTGQQSFVSVWVNRSTLDSAQVIGILTPSHPGGSRAVTLLTFRTEFNDLTAIVTTNTSSPGVFPPDKKIDSVRCPGAKNLTLLLRLHRERVKRVSGTRKATLVRFADAKSRMALEHEKAYQRLVEAGYYSLDKTKENYVPTLKGAYLMTYRLLPPFKQIQRIRRALRTTRVLRETGFADLTKFQNTE